MRLADRYVFSELILPFLIGTLMVLGMLIGNTAFQILPQMLQQKWPINIVLRVLVLNIPTVLNLTLPVATALAASLATGRMTRDLEITVLRGTGIPLVRIFAPILAFGAIIALANLYIADRVVPWAFKEQQNVESLLYNLPKNPIEGRVAFKQDNYVFTFGTAQKIDDKRLRLTKVFVFVYPDRPDANPVTMWSETADYANDVFTLDHPVRHEIGPDGFIANETVAEKGIINLRVNFAQVFAPSVKEDQLAFQELTERAEAARKLGQRQEAINFETERWFKLSLPMMCLVFAFCAPPLALRFSRTGSFAGVLLSIIVVFVAWNTLLLMKYVALGGYLPPVVAAWSTNALFTGIGLWLLRALE